MLPWRRSAWPGPDLKFTVRHSFAFPRSNEVLRTRQAGAVALRGRGGLLPRSFAVLLPIATVSGPLSAISKRREIPAS
jgi:hypothetical protein